MSGSAKLTKVTVEGYRSIGPDGIELEIPTTKPLVLIGENNAGKSNILRALALVLSDSWAGNHDPEDHEFFGRSPNDATIRINLFFKNLTCPYCPGSYVDRITWIADGSGENPPIYGMSSSCRHSSVTKLLKESISCVLIGTDRGLDYQLSYKSKWTTMSKLMRQFHTHLIRDEERVDRLTSYYENLVDVFREVDEFRLFNESLEEYAREFSGNMPYGLGVSFSAYDPSNFYHSLKMSPQLDGQPRSFEELGTGQAQVLAIAFTYAYSLAFGSKGLVLLIEEPESHLHPLAQQWFASRVGKLVEAGCQVVMSTHSPHFIDLSLPGSYALVRKTAEDESTTVTQLKPVELVESLVSMGAPSEKVTPANVGEFYESAATSEIKAGLFARGCVLVEGSTEKFGLQELFSRVGVDTVRHGIAIIPAEGVKNLPKWIRFFSSYNVPIFAIFDSDSHKRTASDAASLKDNRLDIFHALGLDHTLDWNERPEDEDGRWGGYCVLDADYERWIRRLFGETYTDLESDATELFGPSKPLKARWCASKLPEEGQDWRVDEGWKEVRALAERILLTFEMLTVDEAAT